MSAPNPRSLIEGLPTELLERICLSAPVYDVLRLSLVNRAFHGLVRDSPSIQYEIDLFGAGLQRNPRTRTPLADCRTTLEAYRRRWEALHPIEKWAKDFQPSVYQAVSVVSGTFGILWESSANFITLGSASRGIPRREWDIPFEHLRARGFAFYPQADILAVIEVVERTWKIYLKTLSTGEPHPIAQINVLSYTLAPGRGNLVDVLEASITGSRLVMLGRISGLSAPMRPVVVWDWATGQILLELNNQPYRSATFFDDYWLSLVFLSHESVTLTLLNTERATADDMKRTRTVFHFYIPKYSPTWAMRLHFNRGGYKPSPEEDFLAPFYQDSSQQIVAVELHGDSYKSIFVVKIDVLFKLARDRRGADLRWEQLRAHMVEVLPRVHRADLCVSGSRLFRIHPTRDNRIMRMDVYDFSARTSTLYMGTDRRGRTMRPSIEGRHLPRDADMIHFSGGGHDSIAHLTGLDDGGRLLASAVHLWNF